MTKALRVGIYKNRSSDCSNGGISSKFDDVLVVCDEGNYEVDLDDPPGNLCVLEKRILWGEKHYYIRPYAKASGVGWMYGGCIVESSDSRWARLLGEKTGRPLHLHDRTETQAEYDALSS